MKMVSFIASYTANSIIIYFVKIGWRRFSDKKSDLVQPWNRRILNVVYPIGMFTLIVIGSVAQILTCFGRGDVSE